MGWCKQSTCGQLDDGKSAGNDTRARSRGGGLGEDDPDRWASSASDCGMRNGRRASSRMKVGSVRCRAGPAVEKTAHNNFFLF
jgi:hypothetical protein